MIVQYNKIGRGKNKPKKNLNNKKSGNRNY